MIKQYFTDGLIQIAILLSLLRTDLNNLHLHNNYINYPEVQAIILGQSLAYAPTNFHNHYNTLNSLGGSVHPKHIENDYFSSIFSEIRSLSRFRRFDGIATDVNAFLVSDTTLPIPAVVANQQTPSHSNEDSNNNIAQPVIPTLGTSASHDEDASTSEDNLNPINSEESEEYGAVALPLSTDTTGSDPTHEDLDLIEVLWRQDIDLGVGKEVYDINLRRELERDQELELQKKRQKQKELEVLKQKCEEEKRLQEQQWLAQNFTQDGETGEWVPLNNPQTLEPSTQLPSNVLDSGELLDNPLSLEEALDILNAETNGTFMNPGYAVPGNSVQLPPQQQQQQQHQHLNSSVPNSVDNFLLNADSYNNNNQTVQQPQMPLASSLNRQESFDTNWDDLVSLLGFAGVNSSQLNVSSVGSNTSTLIQGQNTANNGTLNINNLNAQHMTNMSSMMPMGVNTTTPESVMNACINSGVLVQNATLPAPVQNITMPAPVTHDILSPVNSTSFMASTLNSSVPVTDNMGSFAWETGDLLFNNVTANQTDPLEDVDGILPEFLPEDELDMVINEGLQTMQMLDDVSSDSAVSMGSASPMQELSDSGVMSPFDGLEGATGGSDCGSPPYSKASKYDPEEYHDRYSSCSYSHSDSSQTNYSTSPNDSDTSKPLGGNNHNHINHNHTYPLKPGASPKEVRTSIKSERVKTKGPHARDMKRANELSIPFTIDQIIESPVEEFNDMITKYKLTEPQIQLIRDIRRRGKNKVAAQNCRKRKLDVVVTLEDEMKNLQDMKEQLIRERQQIDKQTRDMKEKFSHMYQEIFRSLRDEHGQPYDPNEYSLQQSSDGNVFLVPRNVTSDDQQMNINKKRKGGKNE